MGGLDSVFHHRRSTPSLVKDFTAFINRVWNSFSRRWRGQATCCRHRSCAAVTFSAKVRQICRWRHEPAKNRLSRATTWPPRPHQRCAKVSSTPSPNRRRRRCPSPTASSPIRLSKFPFEPLGCGMIRAILWRVPWVRVFLAEQKQLVTVFVLEIRTQKKRTVGHVPECQVDVSFVSTTGS